VGLWLLWWERLRNQITGRRWLQFWDSPLGGWAVRLAGVGLARLPVRPTPGELAPPPPAALPGPAAERAELPEVVERTRTCVRRIQAWREDTSSRRAAHGRSPTPDEQTLERDLDGKLEELEAQLRDFKLKHVGEMPDQQAANLTILGQLQGRLQSVVDAQNRAEQQKSYLQAIVASMQPATPPPQTVDSQETSSEAADAPNPDGTDVPNPGRTDVNLIRLRNERRLAELLSRYGENHPDVQRLKREVEETREIEQEAAREIREARSVPVPVPGKEAPLTPPGQSTTGLLVQITMLDGEIANQKKEQERVLQSIASYQRRVETVPIREQEVADLVREYEMSREHYSNLLAKGMSARRCST